MKACFNIAFVISRWGRCRLDLGGDDCLLKDQRHLPKRIPFGFIKVYRRDSTIYFLAFADDCQKTVHRFSVQQKTALKFAYQRLIPTRR